jgi:hypothetical protein
MLKMPPNAATAMDSHEPGIRDQMCEWRLSLTKPREKIKRISETTAVRWCVQNLLGDKRLQGLLQEAIRLEWRPGSEVSQQTL